MLYTPLNQLGEMLKQTGVSQKKTAQRLNISETHLSMILAGKNQPSFKLYCELCEHVEAYQAMNNKGE